MKNQIIRMLALVLAAVTLCGCQAVRDEVKTTLETTVDEAVGPAQSVGTSTVEAAESTAPVSPLVEAIPHFITGEDARRVAEVLLPGTEFYEMEKEGQAKYSKEEAQRKIDFYSRYAGGSESGSYAMTEEGSDVSTDDVVRLSLDYWKKQGDTAGQGNPHRLCDWTMKSTTNYFDIGADSATSALYATAMVGDLDYTLSATAIDQPDRKISSIFLQLPVQQGNLEDTIYRSLVCVTGEPGQEQVQAIRGKAQDWLDEMNLGKWQVGEATVKKASRGGRTEYSVCVDAVPLWNGVAVEPGTALAGEAYGKSYAFFELTANGELLRFYMYSPIAEKPID